MASLDRSASERAGGKRTEAADDPLPQLPVELMFEIIQRSDAATIVRFAATQKLLRRAILAPAFHRRLAAADNVDPGVLLGFSFREYGVRRAVDTPPLPAGGGGQPLVRLDDASTGRYAFKPVAWRDNLLVVRRDHDDPGAIVDEVRVCNAFTGNATASLPPISMPVPSSRDLLGMAWPALYTPALLTGAGAGCSFELLVADTDLRTQIFSSDRWEWGAVRGTSFPLHDRLPNMNHGSFSCPAVIGRTVYWLCPHHGDDHPHPKILALDVDAAAATVMKIPAYCLFSGLRSSGHGLNDRVLLASVRGQLRLFVLDRDVISAWTPSDSETTMWSQQVMITRSEWKMKTGVDPISFTTSLHLHAFGERSSTMIVEVKPCMLFRIDIGQGFKGACVAKLGIDESKFTRVLRTAETCFFC